MKEQLEQIQMAMSAPRSKQFRVIIVAFSAALGSWFSSLTCHASTKAAETTWSNVQKTQ